MPVVGVIVATVVVAELHVPPARLLLNIAIDPEHMVVGPLIGDGSGFTVIVFVATHPNGVVYIMTTLPAVTPPMVPVVASAVATDVFALLHVPPGVASLMVVTLPTHTDALPVIGSSGFTVTVVVIEHPDDVA